MQSKLKSNEIDGSYSLLGKLHCILRSRHIMAVLRRAYGNISSARNKFFTLLCVFYTESVYLGHYYTVYNVLSGLFYTKSTFPAYFDSTK